MRIKVTSICVDDQVKAQQFYTGVLGFIAKFDLPVGEYRWLTVVSPEGPDELELLLEPNTFPPAQTYYKALKEAGIPVTAFYVDDVQCEVERLKKLGVAFHTEATKTEWGAYAILDDTCGNLIQIQQVGQ
jgi:catechol 2,3-dioxygenase-like lactoylglutathione lyase family enzyme